MLPADVALGVDAEPLPVAVQADQADVGRAVVAEHDQAAAAVLAEGRDRVGHTGGGGRDRRALRRVGRDRLAVVGGGDGIALDRARIASPSSSGISAPSSRQQRASGRHRRVGRQLLAADGDDLACRPVGEVGDGGVDGAQERRLLMSCAQARAQPERPARLE